MTFMRVPKLVDNSVFFATVYRELATLTDAGIVQRIAVDDGPARFEMAPGNRT